MIRATLRRGGPSQLGGDIVIETDRRWYRLAAYVGAAPGSHMGLWCTRTGLGHADLRGLNYRIGSLNRCLTVLAHTRGAREAHETPSR